MNLTDVGMDNFCTFHQQPHFEKNCPQWINTMTLVMNQLLDSKLIEIAEEKEKYHELIETKEEDTLVLWDCVSMFNVEDEGLPDEEEISETNVTTRSQNLLNEDNLILPKIKKLQENMKKMKNNAPMVNIPEFFISSQNPKNINVPIKPTENKVENFKKSLNEHEWDMTLLKTLKRLKKISHCLRCAIYLRKRKSS